VLGSGALEHGQRRAQGEELGAQTGCTAMPSARSSSAARTSFISSRAAMVIA
jgi:hypothetical protein